MTHGLISLFGSITCKQSYFTKSLRNQAFYFSVNGTAVKSNSSFLEPNNINIDDDSVLEAVDEARKAVVRIQSGPGVLSGFFVGSKGLIVSAAYGFGHEGAEEISVTLPGQTSFDARYIGQDRELNIALLQIDFKPKHFYKLANDSVARGESIAAIGFSQGTQLVSIGGKVTAVFEKAYRYTRNSSVRHGGIGGGPVINGEGKVVGIHNTAWQNKDGSWTAEAVSKST